MKHYFYPFSQMMGMSMKKTALMLLVGFIIFSCVEKDNPEPEPQVITAKFDKTEYYPFDAVSIQLTEKPTKQEYQGKLGDSPVTVVRMNDSTLVMMAPDLPAGEYQLTIPVDEKDNGKKIQGRLRIKPLPTVENPETVIDEIKTSFANALADATQEDDPNAALIENLVNRVYEGLDKLTIAERQQLAAFWVVHPELYYESDMELRMSLTDAASKFRNDFRNYFTKVESLSSGIRKFAMFAVIATAFPNPITIGLTSIYLVNLVIKAKETLFAHSQLFDDIIMPFNNMLTNEMNRNSSQFMAEAGNRLEAVILKSDVPYDYTFSNGESFSFNPRIQLRSVTAEDVTGSAPDDVKSFITSANMFITYWNQLIDYLSQAVSGLFLSGSPERIEDIKRLTA
jgi:hypothetical protein